MSDPLGFALAGDEAFFEALEMADHGTWEILCSCCHTAYGARWEELHPQNAMCPNCGDTEGCLSSPAIGHYEDAQKNPPRR